MSEPFLDDPNDIDTADGSSSKGDGNGERDEVKEVQLMAKADTNRIRFWRVVVTVVILAVGLAVTLSTYYLLRDDEDDSFKAAFGQFSSAVSLSATTVQKNIKSGYQATAEYAATQAQAHNMTWPFVVLPKFETFGKIIREYSTIESVVFVIYVEDAQRDAFIEFIEPRYKEWVNESHTLNPAVADKFEPIEYDNFVKKKGPDGSWIPQDKHPFYYVLTQRSPPPTTYNTLNFDAYSEPDYAAYYDAGRILKGQVLTTQVRPFASSTDKDHALIHSQLPDSVYVDHPHSFNSLLVREDPNDLDSPVVGVISGPVAWDASLRNLLPEGVKGIHAVVRNNCNNTFTYEISGKNAFFLGDGDHHDTLYDGMAVHVPLSSSDDPLWATTPGHCIYDMTVYPSSSFEDDYKSQTPLIFAIVVAISFVVMAATFFIYDMFVQRRNRKLVSNAARSNAIVSSLFPGHIRDKFIGTQAPDQEKNFKNTLSRKNSDAFLNQPGSAPIADLFLETTVLFADIVGFTAWSSVREPTQVFTLLESVYAAFDRIARKRQVFKVETVGDCYVAVSGLPDPREDHAVVMVRFARSIMQRMYSLTRELEVTLGPDTGDLSLRIGIHSGPVTAGVLRGDRARFQLFGDTVNTTARIESTGRSGRVHISQETADLLVKAGKGHWLVKRQDLVHAKGKPDMQTYWVQKDDEAGILEDYAVSESEGQYQNSQEAAEEAVDYNLVAADRQERLIDWNVKTLLRLIKQVMARRELIASKRTRQECAPERESIAASLAKTPTRPLEEVKDIITLPEFHQSGATRNVDDVHVSDEAVRELRKFVTQIATMYRSNAFHNFEHASHVTMSVIKMLSRVVAPSDIDLGDDQEEKVKTLHDHTYGITSDPLTQLACAVTALIHDVDHVGVPNAQLLKEHDPLVDVYGERSLLEQNSLALAWDLFMDPMHENIRTTICADNRELAHFRQLLVNGVMATDIVDKELKSLRNQRWDKAFAKNEGPERTSSDDKTMGRDSVNRKATIVIEHLIQASDVSHTMQHWHVYRKWNESFFRECYAAYKAGRAENNPADGWYKGEMGFFDFYIIPLTRKLKDCGVFGKSSDEFLNYAMANRKEWELRGQQVVGEMVEKIAAEERNANPDQLSVGAC
ncbi:hypothetical protein ACA910_004788 [Epithemia clementina (nom. ined.)]